ncbi:MAG: hypothetical protein M1825_001031 [Sarcosagium campestre]|nr:MAG: hypothetical protein M1825_001031 [Sarcosagium campestre]
MAALRNGHVNGHAPTFMNETAMATKRFSDIPSAIDIPVQGIDAEEDLELNLEDALDDPTELCTVLESEGAARGFWMTIALAYAKQRKVDYAIEMLSKGLAAMGNSGRGTPKDRLSMLSCLCWLYLWKSREAPRVIPGGTLVSEARNKDYYLQASTATLNEATRINQSFPPLYLARGVLYLLRASLQPPSRGHGPGSQDSERVETLKQAAKCFEDALRASKGKNMMAVLGRARAQFSLGKYSSALENYQEVLSKMPGLSDPDPRIGIGCCFWQLGFKDDAKGAWDRALDVNPQSRVASVLLGLYYLHTSSQLAPNDPSFIGLYKKAMTEYTQRAFKLDKDQPLTCATFGSYFLSRKAMPTVESLARKAIDYTDINAIASDGWFLLARKEHFANNLAQAMDYYKKADEARGGGDKGHVPAKFAIAQLEVLANDIDGAKYRLEKLIQTSKSVEAMVLLGTLYAEEVFANQSSGYKEDKTTEQKKAIGLLESVRVAWKDQKKVFSPDASVLLNLARLYEGESAEKSLQCLQQVEQIEVDKIPEEERPEGTEDELTALAELRSRLPAQLLNNMGCFQYQAEKYEQARVLFQTALAACVKESEREGASDTDAVVTTVSYNLARSFEADGLLDEAKTVLEGLLERHGDYADAHNRLAYIALRQDPTGTGPKMVSQLMQNDHTNLEVRALYGWYLSKSKKRAANIAEDPEQRHYKHTLQHYDKHDNYALTGMGNLFLSTAREMRRDSDSDKEKRRKTYEKAVEFYDKALQLDPRNAYAAQGVGVALVEDKREYGAGVQIFTKVRDTIKDSSVYINLGHVYAELKQYSRAIENYEAAVAKDRAEDPQILACLGRAWLLKAKQEKSVAAMRKSLEYSQLALALAKDQIHFKFNVAFVQIQAAQLVYTLHENQRTLEEVQTAAEGLDEAIEAFTEIAQSKNPPYPKNDIEQRANMGRNTMRRQLERAVQSQREYEEKNASKLQQARELREAEMKRREEEKQKAEEAALEQKRRIAEERQKIHERDRELAEKRAEEQRKIEEAEYETDSETGEKRKIKKRAGGKRKKKDIEDEGESNDDSGSVGGGGGGGGKGRGRGRNRRGKSGSADNDDNDDENNDDANEGEAPKKKRKLVRKSTGGRQSKFKSSEVVVESDSDDDNNDRVPVSAPEAAGRTSSISSSPVEEGDDDDDEDEAVVQRRRRQ